MNIVVITSRHHYYADLVLRRLYERYGNQVVLVLEQDTIVPRRSKLGGLWQYAKRSGLTYLTAQMSKQLFIEATYQFAPTPGPVHRWETLARAHLLRDTIAAAKPDVIVSVFSKYYVPASIRQLATLGCLNLHPALLPSYQGVSPVFWVLANGETSTGITIHEMTDTIDHGDVYGQTALPILAVDTEHSLYRRCALAGGQLLLEAIDRLSRHEPLAVSALIPSSNFSLPTRRGVHNFRQRHRHFFSLTELRELSRSNESM